MVRVLVVLALLLVAPMVRAADVALAEALFREGRELLEQGRTEEACKKLAESQRLDPSSGTLLNLAHCHETLGRVATAWAQYLEAARLARSQRIPERAQAAEDLARQLEPRVPRLSIRLVSPVAGLEVRLDGTELSQAVVGSALPVDPGAHTVLVTAPDHEDFATDVTVNEGDKQALVEVPPLRRHAPEPRPPVAPQDATVDQAPRPTSSLPPGFWVTGAVTLGAVGVGSAFGVLSLRSYSDADSLCPSHTGCDTDAMSARDRANGQANVSNAAFGTAILAAALTGYFYLTSD